MKERTSFLWRARFNIELGMAQFRLGWVEIALMATALVLVAIGVLTGCGSPTKSAADMKRDAACSATRSMFDEAQTRLLEGPCKDAPTVDDCREHLILREAFIVSLEKLNCPTEE